MNIETLKRAGIEYDSGPERFMGDVELYETVLSMFLSDRSIDEADEARRRGDYSGMFEALHELKGVAGNEDMTVLYRSVSSAVELLRSGPYDGEAIDGAYETVKKNYSAAKQGIIDARED